MLGANLRNGNYDPRMDAEWQYSELGIPGLTDGYNAVVQEMPEMKAGEIHKHDADVDYVEEYFRLNHVNVVADTLQVKTVGADGATITDWTNCTVGTTLNSGALKVSFCDALMGIVKIEVVKAADGTYAFDNTADAKLPVSVYFKYSKRGLAGVPTWMDWDGCVGSVHVLLTK